MLSALIFVTPFKKSYDCLLYTSNVYKRQEDAHTERLIEMETRIAQIGIIVEDPAAAENINRLLHEYSDCIIGRMGMPVSYTHLPLRWKNPAASRRAG